MEQGVAADIDTGPPPEQSKALYTRNSSGMVREVSIWDMLAYNASAAGGTGLVLVIGLFFAFAAFPGANLYIALPLTLVTMAGVWITFSLLTATFPRAGGDYLFGSRILHPIAGLWSNASMAISSAIAFGLYGFFMVNVGLAPTFTIIGVSTGHPWWVHAAETISSKGWTLAIGVGTILLISALSMFRTRLVVRVVTWSVVIGTIGFLVAFLVMLFTSNQSFAHTINVFSEPYTHTHNTYAATVKNGEELGVQYPSQHGYSFKGTLGAIAVGITLFVFYFWGTYMAGEMKGANRRNRQLIASLGAGYVQGIIVVLAAFVFISTAGYNFFAAANSGGYEVPVAPYYNFFASIVTGSPVLSVFMGITFLGFLVPGAYINSSMAQRALFAWSFDGIFPRRVSSVSERTRTPVVAISIVAILGCLACAFIVFDSSWPQIIAVTAVLNTPAVIIAGIAGLVLPKRHPHLYENGPADWRLGGIRVLPLASVGCLVVGIVWLGLLLYFHKAFNVAGAATLPLVLIGAVVLAVVWYAAAAAIQRRKGVELKYVYNTIPPE
ncbi:MAG: APC family permease [Actinobacteria bacterium]|nr:APC family permease [Actinomycetota bacterium]